jgi:hypothetical protein
MPGFTHPCRCVHGLAQGAAAPQPAHPPELGANAPPGATMGSRQPRSRFPGPTRGSTLAPKPGAQCRWQRTLGSARGAARARKAKGGRYHDQPRVARRAPGVVAGHRPPATGVAQPHPELTRRTSNLLRTDSRCARVSACGLPIGARVGTAVGTRWEQIVSPRGSPCPLVFPRNGSPCSGFPMRTGMRAARAPAYGTEGLRFES